MKVSDIEYKRVNFEETAEAVKSCTNDIRTAKNIEQILEAREKYVEKIVEFSTYSALSYMRYTLNTEDRCV